MSEVPARYDLPDNCLVPDWPAPDNIVAFTTLRSGGVSKEPYASWNCADHVGDQHADVQANRQRLSAVLPENTRLHWLQQVHSDHIHRPLHAGPPAVPVGDAWYCEQALQACCILTADCLPVLICDVQGAQVAAVHAGWRGVANRLVNKVLTQFSGPANQLLVWIGPGISAQYFRVGEDVRGTLLDAVATPPSGCYRAAGEHGFSYVDLASMVRAQCREHGVAGVYGGEYCSFADVDRYFSYRRDTITGRNVSLILRQE